MGSLVDGQWRDEWYDTKKSLRAAGERLPPPDQQACLRVAPVSGDARRQALVAADARMNNSAR